MLEVSERLDEVNKEMAQVRQEEITTELMDILMGHLDEEEAWKKSSWPLAH